MSEVKIDAQVVNGEPYVSLYDLVEWLIMVNDEMEEKGVPTEALVSVIHNLHSQSVELRKQIEEAKKSSLSNIKEDLKQLKLERDNEQSG